MNLINFLCSTYKKQKLQVFRKIEKYLLHKRDEEYLKETNDNLSAINSVINIKNKSRGVEKLDTASSVSELELLYDKIYSHMRDNLTKEIKRTLFFKKVYKNTSLMKGVFFIFSRELVQKRISKRFSQWRSNVEMMRLRYINAKIEKFSVRKQNLSLALVAKIVDKVSVAEANLKIFSFERLILFCKLKGTLKDYGFIYKNIPDLIQNEDQKEMCSFIRQSYTKPIKLLKLKLILARKISPKSLLFKKKQTVSPSGFALNSAFLKWKKKVIDLISEPARRMYSITSLVKAINTCQRRSMKFFLKNLCLKNEEAEAEVRIIDDKKVELCILLEKVIEHLI